MHCTYFGSEIKKKAVETQKKHRSFKYFPKAHAEWDKKVERHRERQNIMTLVVTNR